MQAPLGHVWHLSNVVVTLLEGWCHIYGGMMSLLEGWCHCLKLGVTFMKGWCHIYGGMVSHWKDGCKDGVRRWSKDVRLVCN